VRRPAAGSKRTDDWIGLREATEMLGVSASTLRRWADEGTVRTFVTPGGHRRFSRTGIDALLPGSGRGATDPDILAGETPVRMQRVYRRAVQQGVAADMPWVSEMSPTDRDLFRDHGRRIVVETLAALEAGDERTREDHLVRGEISAEAYGRAAAAVGLPASAAVALFLRFRGPFMAELAAVTRRRALPGEATARILETGRESLDRLLVAMVRAYETTAVAWRPAGPRPPSATPESEPPMTAEVPRP
jgi:excisionase family DNA binding protein